MRGPAFLSVKGEEGVARHVVKFGGGDSKEVLWMWVAGNFGGKFQTDRAGKVGEKRGQNL